jgi:hypothetical protein
MIALCDSENLKQVLVKWDRKFPAGLLLYHPDRSIADIGPGHAVHIATALTGVEHERERKPLFRADWPPLFEFLDFGVSPRADFVCLWSSNAK